MSLRLSEVLFVSRLEGSEEEALLNSKKLEGGRSINTGEFEKPE